MHILKRMRMDKETGKKTLLRCLNNSYSRYIQSQLNLTAVKSDLVKTVRADHRHPFTNMCKPNTEIQTRFLYSFPSGTRKHSGSVQPHLVEREPSPYVQLRRKAAVVLAEGASYRSGQHLPLFSQRLHRHLLALLASAYVTSPLFASEEYSKNIPPQPPCLSQI